MRHQCRIGSCNEMICNGGLVMGSTNDYVREYTAQLRKGYIQKAYKGIMTFLYDLKAYLERKYPDFMASALYFGYMDMSYFAFTPAAIRSRKLKIAIVFLHEECRFELWLAGNNRQTQAEYVELFKHKDIGEFTLSQVQSGVDSIIAYTIIGQPDFDRTDELKRQIESGVIAFAKRMEAILD